LAEMFKMNHPQTALVANPKNRWEDSDREQSKLLHFLAVFSIQC